MKLTKSKLKDVILETLNEQDVEEALAASDPTSTSMSDKEIQRHVNAAIKFKKRLPTGHPGYEIWQAALDSKEEEPTKEPTKGPTKKAQRKLLIQKIKQMEKEIASPATPARKKRDLKKRIASANLNINRLGKEAAGLKTTADSHKLEPLYRTVQKQWRIIAKDTKDPDLKKAMNYIRRIAIAEVKRLKENYYVVSKNDPLPIKEVVANWAAGERPYDEKDYHAIYPIDDLLEFRDFEWTEEGEQKSPEEWNKLLQDVKETGIIEPVVMYVGHNGQAKIGEGNHKIAIAQQLNIKELPVKFVFTEEEVRKASKMTLEPAEINVPAEDVHPDRYYTR